MAVAGQCKNHCYGDRDPVPETDRKPAVILLLHGGNKTHQSGCDLAAGHCNDIPSRHPVCSKEPGNPVYLLLAFEPDVNDQEHGNNNNDPIQPKHFFTFLILVIVCFQDFYP